MSSRRVSVESSEIRKIAREIGDRYAELVVASELSGIRLSEETEYIRDMLEEHPEYAQDFLTGKERDGMSPRMHIITESVVQKQIASNYPPEVRETHLALMAGPKLDAHEARHALGAIFMQLMWHLLRENWSPDRILSEYKRRLKELAAKKTRDEVWKDLV